VLPRSADALPPATFAVLTNYTVAGYPRCVVTGDFNNDGKLDLAFALQSGAGLMLGNGDGTFSPAVNYTFGAGSVWNVAVADLDMDGRLDLLAADINTNVVHVLLGNGDGTLQAPVDHLTVGRPRALAVSDLNGDGKLDVAAVNVGGRSLSILIGNGTGQLSFLTNYFVGGSLGRITVGDFDEDGIPDLATLTPLSLFFGNGDGTFRSETSYSDLAGNGVKAADLNSDGHLDLVVAPGQILFGDGKGKFQPPRMLPATNDAETIATADFNGDGKLDLVLSSETSSGITFVMGAGDGTFGATNFYETGYIFTTSVAVGDFNGDGKPDVAAANYGGMSLTIFMNTTEPQLHIGRATNDVLLTWPDWPGYVLQSTTDLRSAEGWSSITNHIATSNGVKSFFAAPGQGAEFFRLQKLQSGVP
jgi:hypothetical protein